MKRPGLSDRGEGVGVKRMAKNETGDLHLSSPLEQTRTKAIRRYLIPR